MLASRLCARAIARPRAVAVPFAQHVGLSAGPSAIWASKRVFASTPRHRKDDAGSRIAQAEQQAKQPTPESVKPESVEKEKPAEPTRPNDPLLSEQMKTTKEQRRADWRIIKDMSHYIWPKDDLGTRFRVGLSVVLLVGAKVGLFVQHPSVHQLIAVCRSSTSKCLSTSRPSSIA